ncbi:MAG: hypothetical protein ABIG68_09475, partial [Acidobacteriota bacterium]
MAIVTGSSELLTTVPGIGKKVARLPGVGRVLGPILWNEKNLDATYVPVGEIVDVPPGNALPLSMIEEFVNRASHRFIMGGCLCRTAHACDNFSPETGCLFLGDAAADIEAGLGRSVSAEEAIEHVVRARNQGLLPCIIHGSFDASLLRIDYRRMLAICFCCDCCCVFRTDMKKGPAAYRDRIIRLPGLTMEGAGSCTGCGACADLCFLGAVSIGPGGPVFAEFCKGCARCADVCPQGNIRVRMDPSGDSRAALLTRIGARTDIS